MTIHASTVARYARRPRCNCPVSGFYPSRITTESVDCWLQHTTHGTGQRAVHTASYSSAHSVFPEAFDSQLKPQQLTPKHIQAALQQANNWNDLHQAMSLDPAQLRLPAVWTVALQQAAKLATDTPPGPMKHPHLPHLAIAHPSRRDKTLAIHILRMLAIASCERLNTMDAATASSFLGTMGLVASKGYVTPRTAPMELMLAIGTLLETLYGQRLAQLSINQQVGILQCLATLTPEAAPLSWIQECMQNVYLKMEFLNADSIGIAMASFAQVCKAQGWQLPEQWLVPYLRLVLFRLPSLSTVALAQLIHGLAELRVRPYDEWLNCFHEEIDRKVHEFSTPNLAAILVAYNTICPEIFKSSEERQQQQQEQEQQLDDMATALQASSAQSNNMAVQAMLASAEADGSQGSPEDSYQ